MKKTIILASVLMLSLMSTVTGCTSKQPVKTSLTVPSKTDSSAPAQQSASPKLENTESITNYSVSRMFQYSSDVAWVETYDEIWRCIDKSGTILFILESKNEPVSHFIDGIAVIDNDTQYQSITTTNEVVASLNKEDYANIIISNNMAFLEKKTSTLQGDDIQYGLFDMSKNSWLTPLGQIPHEGYNNVSSVSYLGDNVYLFNYGVLFNTSTQSIYEDANRFSFVDGIGVRRVEVEGNAYIEKINLKDFSITKILDLGLNSYSSYCKAFSANLFLLYNDENFKNGLYDTNGQLVSDFSEYKFQGDPFVVDGYLYANLVNPSNTTLATIFDKTGKIVFGPHEDTLDKSHVSDGLLRLNKGFYDMQGNLVIKLEPGYSEFGFHNEVCWIISTNKSGTEKLSLINKIGETLFETRVLNN